MLFVVLVGVVGCAWISYETFKKIEIRDILRREGYTLYGVVTKRSVSHGNVYLRYQFSVDSVSYSGQAEMKTDHYRVPALGEQIPIRYLPKDPHVNQPSN